MRHKGSEGGKNEPDSKKKKGQAGGAQKDDEKADAAGSRRRAKDEIEKPGESGKKKKGLEQEKGEAKSKHKSKSTSEPSGDTDMKKKKRHGKRGKRGKKRRSSKGGHRRKGTKKSKHHAKSKKPAKALTADDVIKAPAAADLIKSEPESAQEAILSKVELIPSETVTFVPNERRQQTYMVIHNGSTELIMFKLKSTRPGLYKTKPVYGLVPAGEKFAVRLVYTGIRVGLKIPTNDRFTIVLAKSPDPTVTSGKAAWRKIIQRTQEAAYSDAEIKKKKVMILFAGVNDKKEDKEGEEDKKTAKEEETKKGEAKADTKADAKEKKDKTTETLKEGKTLEMSEKDDKTQKKDIETQKKDIEPPEKDKIKAKTPKAEADEKKPAAKEGKKAKEELAAEQTQMKEPDQPEPADQKLEGDATQMGEPADEGDEKEGDEKDEGEAEGQHEEEDEKHAEAGDSRGTNVTAKTPGGSDPAASDPGLRKREMTVLHRDGKKVITIIMYREPKIPEELISRSGDDEDDDDDSPRTQKNKPQK